MLTTNDTKSGIYRIRNVVTGDRYIGSAVNLKQRSFNHESYLRRGKHKNAQLQRAYKKYGAESFVFEVLFYCPAYDLLKQEQVLLDSKPEYNHCLIAGSRRGTRQSEEAKAKVARAMRGRKVSPDTLAKTAATRAANPHKHSDAMKARMSTLKKGVPLTPKHVANRAKAQTGLKRSAEARKNLKKGQEAIRVAVEAIDPATGEIKHTFASLADAEAAGFPHACVSRCINGLRPTHRGFIWRRVQNHG